MARQDRGNRRCEARPLTVAGWAHQPEPDPRRRRTPVADLFEETFRLYRDNFPLLLAISAIFQLPLVIASVPFAAWQAELISSGTVTPPRVSPEQAGAIVLAAGVFSLLAVILSTFQQGAVSYIVGRARIGDRAPAREVALALRRLARPLLACIGWIIVGAIATVLLLVVGLTVVVVVVAVLGGGPAAVGGLTIIAVLALVVAIFVATARFALTIPAIVLERSSALNGFRRSWQLTRGATLRTLGIFVLVSFVVGVVAGIASPFFLPGVMEGVLEGSPAAYALVALVSGAAQIVVAPVPAILLVVLYFDYSRPPAST